MKAKHLVVDTAAFVKNLPLWEYGEEFFSVPEVIAEIRDRTARQRYEALPVSVTMREPQPWAIRFINQFSKKTGDYASLSLADVKIVALAYELEIEARGSSDHLRLEPQKPIIEGFASKPKLDDQENVAGFHVPTEESDGLLTDSSDIVLSESCTRDVQTNSSDSSSDDLCSDEDPNVYENQDQSFTLSSLSLKNSASDSTHTANIYWRHMLGLEEFLVGHSYIGGYSPTSDDSDIYKALIKEYPQFCPLLKDKYAALFSNHNLPPPTTIRPLHSTFPCIRRWSYHIASFSEDERSQFPSSSRDIEEVLREFGEKVQNMEGPVSSAVPNLIGKNTALLDPALHMNALSITEQCNGVGEAEDANKKETTINQSSIDNDVAVEGDSSHTKESEEDSEVSSSCDDTDLQNENDFEGEEANSEDLEYFGENEDDEEEDDDDDDEGWITPSNIKRHKLKSNNKPVDAEEKEKDVLVACITSDFAVQNLLKHIGLSVMGVDGKLIWQIRTYILRCYACFKTTSDMTKIFCPKCGNKTLKRVSVTVNPDGTQKIFINFKKPINTKGMRFTLPRPRGGQHARNPILVADQREVKQFSSKMSKKKINPLHEDYDPSQAPFAVRDVYSRAAQLGYMGGKCHNHYYWESKNPNAPMKKLSKKKK